MLHIPPLWTRPTASLQRTSAMRCVFWWMVTLAFLTVLPTTAQINTTAIALPDTTALILQPRSHTPRGALWRSAVVPGWGQYYNRQYLKIPIVYLGLGGLTAYALQLNSRYLTHKHAALYKQDVEDIESGPLEENRWPEYASEYKDLIADIADGLPVAASTLRARRDVLRRNRDLLFLGTGLWYMLSVLDAFVSAHLLDFDVSEDLTVTFYPEPTPSGMAVTVRLGF